MLRPDWSIVLHDWDFSVTAVCESVPNSNLLIRSTDLLFLNSNFFVSLNTFFHFSFRSYMFWLVSMCMKSIFSIFKGWKSPDLRVGEVSGGVNHFRAHAWDWSVTHAFSFIICIICNTFKYLIKTRIKASLDLFSCDINFILVFPFCPHIIVNSMVTIIHLW